MSLVRSRDRKFFFIYPNHILYLMKSKLIPINIVYIHLFSLLALQSSVFPTCISPQPRSIYTHPRSPSHVYTHIHTRTHFNLLCPSSNSTFFYCTRIFLQFRTRQCTYYHSFCRCFWCCLAYLFVCFCLLEFVCLLVFLWNLLSVIEWYEFYASLFLYETYLYLDEITAVWGQDSRGKGGNRATVIC